MRADARVIVLGEDVAEGGPYGGDRRAGRGVRRRRACSTRRSARAPICGVAIGAAQAGLRPVVEIMFIDFITLALDQLVNQAAKAHFMSGGQLSRADGAAHAGRRRPAAAAPSTRRAWRPG